MQKEIDPKLVGGIIALVVLLVGGFMFMKFRTPADFSGPPIKFKPPRGFAIPAMGGRPAGATVPGAPATGAGQTSPAVPGAPTGQPAAPAPGSN